MTTGSSRSRPAIEWDTLRKQSILPGGFGPERVNIWPQLLGVSPASARTVESLSAEKDGEENNGEEQCAQPHRDERQIRLDTDRSFVLYPTSLPDRETLQEDLHALIASVFRKRPKLNYFQGFHDIISVLFLTLPPDLQLACAEKLSLHRVRDSMGSTLEPVLGLLRVTKNLLRLADPKYAETLERSSPLPFHALSNLLTLFSHDMPTLPLIQHVFDYLLCRPPIAVVYLATAVILARKSDIERLLRDDEYDGDAGMGMTHSLLNALPEISDDVLEIEVPKTEESVEENSRPANVESLDTIDGQVSDAQETVKQEDGIPNRIVSVKQDALAQPNTDEQPGEPDIPVFLATPPISMEESRASSSSPPEETLTGGERDISIVSKAEESITLRPSTPEDSKNVFQSTTSPTRPRSPPPPQSPPSLPEKKPLRPPTPPHRSTSTHALTTLSSLLTSADTLYELYPPIHPGLAMSSIMGPQSVVYTWREPKLSCVLAEAKSTEWEEQRIADDEAEAMVSCPGLVVYPYIDEKAKNVDDDNYPTSEEEVVEEEEEESWRWWNEKRRMGRKQRSKEKKYKNENLKGKRRPRKLRKNPLSRVERRTMLAGAVVVLGVAMAVYGARVGRSSSAGWDTHHGREWRTVGSWVGGALVGVVDRIGVFSKMRD